MQAKDIIPILIPGAIIQIMVQAYFIKHCWDNALLTRRQKAFTIFAIAIFNIPAAAIYLFLTRSKTNDYNDFKDIEPDIHIKLGIFVLLVVSYEIFSLRTIVENLKNTRYQLIIGLLTVCFVIMLVNALLVKKQHKLFYYLLPLIQIFLIMPVEYLDSTRNAPFLVLVVVAGIINNYPINLSRIYSLVAFFAYIFVSLAKAFMIYGYQSDDEIFSYMYANILVFLLVFAAFYMLKKQLLTNKRLGAALEALKEQSLKLETMSAAQERNRIAGEIHDTVGHVLTSAVIAIEAGEKLLSDNQQAAIGKFTLAKEQVRRSLNEIRNSVRTIKMGGEKKFIHELKRLLDEIKQNTGLAVSDIVELKTDLLPIQQNVLLLAVKECATNSLKHSGSSEADLLVQEYKDSIHLTFSDNGPGNETATFGFGLSSMEERVKSIGGTMGVSSTKGEGFTVNIVIPTGVKAGGHNE